MITKLLPSRLPFLSNGHAPPAELLIGFVDNQIAKFQVRVTAKAAEHRAETRWWWQRRVDKFAAHFRWVCWLIRSVAACAVDYGLIIFCVIFVLLIRYECCMKQNTIAHC